MAEDKTKEKYEMTGLEIAVIGMAGRFPGAKNIGRFWENLANGIEAITFFSEQELLDAGTDPQLLAQPNYVKAKAILDDEDIECFDASFFGYTPAEAGLMDPQMRVFHELAWEALEDAGYEPGGYKGMIGLYAGAAHNHYWEALCTFTGKSGDMGPWTSVQYMDKDFFAMRVSHSLNLAGPSFAIYTACSTSLTAIHLACQALVNGECDMALAGGITILLPNKTGYTYQEGMIMSPDGHCRAFDAQAQGTVGGSGGGIVVLKLLEDATADRDYIYAIVKGSAVNNDGTRKGGFTAPSVEGQAEVIQAALRSAHVEPGSISYIETHGTATPLGDPIEMEALKLVFNTGKKEACAIGSIKTNMGHLDAAAGAAGFIKTVLALQYRLLPPSLHFKTPNPAIDFEHSPFYVNTELKTWANEIYPLRAGVSSFGIGGTNAHIILEEFIGANQYRYVVPWVEVSAESREEENRQYQLILLSAKSSSALEKMTGNLAKYLTMHSFINPGDVAYTLQVGRREFKHRRMLVSEDLLEAIELLSGTSNLQAGKVKTFSLEEGQKPIVFMFSGLGGQYVNMGRELYEKELLFRKEMDRCFEILKTMAPYDLKEIMYPGKINDTQGINQPEIAQAAVFILEYSLAALLSAWGIRPRAMIGYSFGEYAAACFAGVFSLEEALKLVVARGQAIRQLPDGAMSSVPLPVKELEPLLANHTNIAIAIDNGSSCVVAGPTESIAAFETYLKEKKYLALRVQGSRAIHSPMMTPMAGKFKENFRHMNLKNPKIPYVSNVTATWIRSREAADPQYWANHLQQTVRFADGIKLLLNDLPNCILLEIGPGRDIGTLAQRHIEARNQQNRDMNTTTLVLNLVRHPQQQVSDVYFLLSRIGRLWLNGQAIDWSAFYAGEKHQRIPLPTYPFEGQHYRIDRDVFNKDIRALDGKMRLYKKNDMADWFYIPSWKRINSAVSVAQPLMRAMIINESQWLVFMDECGLGAGLLNELEKMGGKVITVSAATGGTFFAENQNHFIINPQREEDYHALFNTLHSQGRIPDRVLHLWGVTGKAHGQFSQELGFYSLLNLARAVGTQDQIRLLVVTDNMQEVVGSDGRCPEKATVLGPVKIIPLEYTNITCRSVDLDLVGNFNNSDEERQAEFVRQLLAEAVSSSDDPVVAYRGSYRWIQAYEPLRLEDPGNAGVLLKPEGVYLITGGLGGIGLILAHYLAESVRAKLILIGRKTHLRTVKKLEELGAEVLVLSADVTCAEQMTAVVAQAEGQFGPINGIIHCAGLADGQMIQLRTRQSLEQVLAPKLDGTRVLDNIFKDRPLDFLILCSSTGAILPMIGQVAYCAANSFLDAFAHYQRMFRQRPVIAIDWDRWRQVGIAVIAETQHKKTTGQDLDGGLTAAEGTAAFKRILATPLIPLPQITVFTRDLPVLLTQARALTADSFMQGVETGAAPGSVAGGQGAVLLQRPDLDNRYVPAETRTEEKLCRLWAEFFGLEKVGSTDDFIELGGDSLKALMLLPKIYKACDVQIPVAEFFNRPTIQGLAAYIDGADKQTYTAIEPLEKMAYYELAPAQKRLFSLQHITPAGTAYNEFSALALDERYLVNLESNIKTLIQRHESLRTSFHMLAGEPVQRIHGSVDFKVEYPEAPDFPYIKENNIEKNNIEDMAVDKVSRSRIEATLKQFVRPFDLSQPPLLRAGVLTVEPGRHVLLFDIHHLIADGRSSQVFMEELGALCENGAVEFPPLPIQYKDFVGWQKHFRRQHKDAMEQQKQYWLGKFKNPVPLLELPLDYPRPAVQSFEGKQLSFELDSQRWLGLKEIAANAETTFFTVLLAIFNIFLSKLSGREDIVVGTPILGRNHPEVQSIMGMFVNTQVFRGFPSGDKRFFQFLTELKRSTIEALENQDYPFEELIEQLGIPRDAGRNPLFNVSFAMLNTRGLKPDKARPDIIVYKLEHRMAKFDLGLEIMEGDNNLYFNLLYSTKLFKKETVERFIIYFNEIIDIVIENRNIYLKDILISHGLPELDPAMPEVDFKF